MKKSCTLFVLFLLVIRIEAQPLNLKSRLLAIPGEARSDSLTVQNPEVLKIEPAGKHRLEITPKGYLGFGTMIVFGALSWYFHQEAETAYDLYLHSGNISKMKQYYDRSVKYDKLTGWSYVGFQVGFLITVISFNR
jgi:hypothetical protein